MIANLPIGSLVVGEMLPKFRLRDLEDQIKAHGVTEETAPTVMHMKDGTYILKHGIFTYKVAHDLGLTEIPCIILEET